MIKTSSIALVAVLAAPSVMGVALWGQCGGQNWPSNQTTCDAGSVCVYSNPWYSQCLPGTSSQAPPASTSKPATTVQASSTTKPASTTAPVTSSTPNTGTGLNGKFKGRGKLYWGSCTDQSLLNNSQNANVLKAEMGQLTCENSMKWDATEPSKGSFSLSAADVVVQWAQTNGKLMRGHTFVWHSQLPGWVTSINDKTTLTSVLNTHINTLIAKWKGKILQWDVANEVLNEDGTLRSSVWYNVLGQQFLNIAFATARSADPAAKLYLNEYNTVEYGASYAKTKGMVTLVTSLKSAGVPIDGIGAQAHLMAGQGSSVSAALNALAVPVNEVAITELDIVGAASNDYTAVTNACLSQPKCVGITSWGISDTNSWRSSQTPLLWNGSFQPKAAYTAIMAIL